jgi:O-antigen/teichoic acid export membrane protein
MFGKTFFGAKYLTGWEIVPVILLGYMFHGMYVNFTAGIYIEEKNKYLPFITGAGAFLNIVVNLFLIPRMGIMGAALATLAAYALMAGLIYIFAQKYYRINYEYRKVVTILALVVAACCLYYYLFYSGQLYLIYKFIILAAFIVLLFVLKVVRKRELVLTFNALMRRG